MTDIPQSQIDSRLHGNGLKLVRLVWFIVALAALGIFIFSLPGYLRSLGESRPIQASPEFIAVFEVIGVLVSLAVVVVSLALAGLLFWRKPDDKMALFLSFFFLGYGIVMAGPLERLHLAFPNLALNAELAQPVVMTAPFVALFALFPNGRFVPGWMRWVTLGSLGFMALYFLAPCCDYSDVSPWLSGLITLSGLTVLALVIYGQIYRYRHISSPVERQQTKWVVYGLVLFLVWVIVVSVPYAISQSLPADVPLPWWTLLASAGWWLSLTIIPLSLALSILRYRLFEIDLIIKRTVQYALISGAGFIIYLLAVGGTSMFLQSNIELVAGIIALVLVVIFFNPARQRLQAVLDRLMPYTPPPPEVLAEMEREKAEREMKEIEIEKEGQKRTSATTANWLMVARIGWLAFFAFATLVLLFAIPARWAQLTQPTPITLANLNALGWPVMGYAVYSITTEVFFTATFLVVGLLIFARRSNDGMALFMSLTLVAYGVGNGTITPTLGALSQYPFMGFILQFFGYMAWVTFTQFPYLFPNGRYVPRWARIPALIWFVLCIPWNFLPADSPFGVLHWPPAIFASLLLFLWGSWVVCQIYRYARVSTPLERQQTKWVVYALAMIVVCLMSMFVGAFLFGNFEAFNYLIAGESPTPQIFVFIAVFQAVARLAVLLLPLAFAFSIFRYHLYDIDIVIKRTVQYALISGAGFVIYLLAVGGTSLFLQSNTEWVAGVIALALVVIFFNPARQRLQVVMDKLMPYTPPPPDVLAEMEREQAEAERKRLAKMEAQKQTATGDTRLHGPWLTVARALWLLLSTAAVIAFIVSLVIAWREPFPSCTTPDAVCGPWQVSQEDVGVAQQLGLPIQFMQFAYFVPLILARVSFVVVGLLIFWRKSNDWVALLLSLMLMLWLVEGVQNLGAWMPVVNVLYLVDTVVFYLLPFIFPSGRFVPRWTRWVVLLTIVFTLPLLFGPTLGIKVDDGIFGLALVASFIPWMLVAGYAVLHRYRRVSDATERQQIKWVMTGLLSTFIIIIPFAGVATMFPPSQPSPERLAFITLVLLPISTLAYFAVSGGIAFAILRYRLYDIDIVIRRTVQYAVISALGFGVYLLAVGGTSLFLQSRNDLLAGVLALGAAVAAFVWLRPRLEAVMDKYAPLPPKPPEATPLSRSSKTDLPLEPNMTRPLSSVWQRLIRAGWVVLAISSMWTFGWTLFYTWEFTSSPPLRIAEGLAGLGVSTTLYFAANAIPIALLFLSYFTVAVLMFWRLPNDRMALFTAVFLMGFGVANAFPVAPEFTRQWFTLGQPHYFIPFLVSSLLSWPLITAFFALYPDGVFTPRWMRWVAVYGFLFSIVWAIAPQAFAAPSGWFAVFVYGSLTLFYAASLLAQVYRYFKHATLIQRQQIRWMVYSLAVIFVANGLYFSLYNPAATPTASVRLELLLMPLNLTYALLPLAIGVAIFRYRLFEMEIIIRRTVVYGAIVGGLGVAYFGGVALLQWLSQALTGPQSNFVVVLVTLGIVALFNPVRRRFQVFIDRAFYREKVDFREAFTAFAREVRTIIDLPELLRTLVNRTTELLHITHGAVYLSEAVSEATSTDGTEETDKMERIFKVAEGKNLPERLGTLRVSNDMRERLQKGQAVSRPGHNVFPLLVPLIAPVTHSPNDPLTQSLIGVLALGPRLSDQAYSQEDQTLLTSLADQAGTAVYVAQLIQEKQAETQRIEEAERRLESYAHSPAGRAERFAQSLIIEDPRSGTEGAYHQSAITELHALLQTAGTDPAAAAMLEPLSAALTSLNAPTLAGLADGYRYIFASQATPEVLPVGLRTLTDHLTQLNAPEALELYRLCQKALEANSISAIVEQGLAMSHYSLPIPNDLQPLVEGLQELAPAADALRAYERVDAQQDKLAYLASAVERLTHADRAAQAELGAADRPIVQRIAANWLTVVTGTMSELQTRARLVCRLLTRHTWTGEVIAVALAIRNEGRGAALNLKVALAPAPDYTLVDESVLIERLAAGEEAQAELRVRPHMGDKTGITGGQFRARFALVYADPRGPDQTENFADVVYLLALEGEFKFIPNPYVVGTPLQTGSALFCGREDVFEFIQENLVAAHQNNLVLIGQRRTGKTSLLKQLPARLGEKYVSVYLDGQSLALDPGLPNFFYSLATEIAFTLEDRGLAVGDLPDFNDSPAMTFERKFLARVREALGDRHLLLLLDEFEELESAVRRGNLDVSVFGFLRHMIQHSENLSVIFCGTHRMEELAADYWSVLFNISLYRHVAFLQQAEAFKLIQEPVGGFGMKYDDLALDKMWRVTAGHPYFLQLLCHSLVNQHNKSKRNYVTVADVNAALDEILASGEAHFIFLWTESTREERLALTALSRMMPLTGQANPVQVSDYLAERGVPLERRAVSEAMHHLALRDTLRVNRDLNDSGGSETFSWQLGLLGLWVEKYKSLSRVVDEVRT